LRKARRALEPAARELVRVVDGLVVEDVGPVGGALQRLDVGLVRADAVAEPVTGIRVVEPVVGVVRISVPRRLKLLTRRRELPEPG
jgi:hypothetical protein